MTRGVKAEKGATKNKVVRRKAGLSVIVPSPLHSSEAVMNRLPDLKEIEEIFIIAIKKKDGNALTFSNMTIGAKLYYMEAIKHKMIRDAYDGK